MTSRSTWPFTFKRFKFVFQSLKFSMQIEFVCLLSLTKVYWIVREAGSGGGVNGHYVHPTPPLGFSQIT